MGVFHPPFPGLELGVWWTRVSEAGVCRGSDTPNIYVGPQWGILICISPLEKSNTYPCKLYATRTEMLGKAIWRLRIQENPSAAGLRSGPRWRSLQRSRKPPSWWGGAGCPLPKNPIPPALGPSGHASPTPTPKLVPTPLRGDTTVICERTASATQAYG